MLAWKEKKNSWYQWNINHEYIVSCNNNITKLSCNYNITNHMLERQKLLGINESYIPSVF